MYVLVLVLVELLSMVLMLRTIVNRTHHGPKNHVFP